jgi:GTPase SAR1 family protein
MSRTALFIIGSAGTGKTTFCATLLEHYAICKKPAYYVNLDPAARESAVTDNGHGAVIDIREKYTLNDIMSRHDLGPNGALLLCLEKFGADYDYLNEKLRNYSMDEFLLIDCPGQIETILHEEAIPNIIRIFQENDYNVGAAFLLDATFIENQKTNESTDYNDNDENIDKIQTTKSNKLVAGMLNSLGAMLQLNVPFINIVTKMDLIGGIEGWDADWIESIFEENPYNINDTTNFTNCVQRILSTYGLSQLLPLDVTDIESVTTIATQIDYLLQIEENLEQNEKLTRKYENDEDE